MKQSSHFSALLLFLLCFISSSKLSASFIATKKGQEEVKLDEITSWDSLIDMEGSDSINQLMGSEDCDKEDKECLRRRIILEVHLDYIYTQHHKP